MMTRNRTVLEWGAVAVASILWIALVDFWTNQIPSGIWDTWNYIAMVETGIWGNKWLASPFAYRFGGTTVVSCVKFLLGCDTLSAFVWTMKLGALATLMLSYGFARSLTGRIAPSAVIALLVGMSFAHVKLVIYYPTMIESPAFPWMIATTWAWYAGRRWAGVALGCVGVCFREFVAVPLLAILWRFLEGWWADRRWAAFWPMVLAGLAFAVAVAGPRLTFPIVSNSQVFDPFSKPETLLHLLFLPANAKRDLNILAQIASYWLPTLLLLTPVRWRILRDDLTRHRWLFGNMFGLLIFLIMFGGVNLSVYSAYFVGLQIIVLGLLLKRGVRQLELVWAVACVFFFNKLYLPIPSPVEENIAHMNFFGGPDTWMSRVLLLHYVKIPIMVAGAFGLRWLLGKYGPLPDNSPPHREAPSPVDAA